MNKKPLTERFMFWAVVLVIVWAGVPVLAKLGSGQLNGFEMTFWINVFAMPVVTLWIIPRQQRTALAGYSLNIILKLIGVGFLGNLIYQVMYFSSYRTITALTGSVLTRLGGIFFVVASMLFLKERHSKANLIAVIVATFGAILSAAKPGARLEFAFTVGFWLIVLGTVLNTVYSFANNALKKKFPDVRVNLFVYKAGTLVTIALWAILMNNSSTLAGSSWYINLHPSLHDLFTPFVIGVFADGIGFLAWLKLLELGDSVKATIVSAIIAVAQVVLAVLIFHEDASWINAGLAPALVIIPVAWASLIDARARKSAITNP